MRIFRMPPLPGMIFPEAGSASSCNWKSLYSSPESIEVICRVNTWVSINSTIDYPPMAYVLSNMRPARYAVIAVAGGLFLTVIGDLARPHILIL
jgi:hypothetical protein